MSIEKIYDKARGVYQVSIRLDEKTCFTSDWNNKDICDRFYDLMTEQYKKIVPKPQETYSC